MLNLKDKSLQANCPGCNNLITFSLKQAQDEEQLMCPGCGQLICLKDKDGSVEKITENINSTLKVMGEMGSFKINIKL